MRPLTVLVLPYSIIYIFAAILMCVTILACLRLKLNGLTRFLVQTLESQNAICFHSQYDITSAAILQKLDKELAKTLHCV